MATVAPGRRRPSSRVVTTPLTVIRSWACTEAGTSASTARRKAARRRDIWNAPFERHDLRGRADWRPSLSDARRAAATGAACPSPDDAAYFRRMRRTKIVATIGPASRERKVLESLAQAGVDVVRLNFSHGEHEQHLQVIEATREIAAHLGPAHRAAAGPVRPQDPHRAAQGRQAGRAAQGRERITITTDETIEGTDAAHLHDLRAAAPGRLARRPHPPRRRQPRAARGPGLAARKWSARSWMGAGSSPRRG